MQEKNNNLNPRIIVIQKLYGHYINKEAEITFPKHRYKKFIKDVVNGTIERNEIIQELIENGNEKSFGCITVDSDTSTSDMLLMFSTNQAKHNRIIDKGDPRLKDFTAALNMVLVDLAKKIVIDGEGAKKFIQINI